MNESWLSVEDAAALLGRSAPQVRKLAQDGTLPGRRLAGVWLLDRSAVAARAAQTHGPGRPLSAANAWLVLALLAHELDADQPVPVVNDRQKRYQLRKLIENAPSVERWAQWLRNRARPRRVWVHDGVLDDLAADPRLRPSGAYAAQQAGTDLAGGTARVFYVNQSEVASVLADYRAQDDPAGQVLLRVVDDDVASVVVPAGGRPVPLAVAAVDLLESGAARERHLGVDQLRVALGSAKASMANGVAHG